MENPAFEVVRVAKRFKKPTTRPNQLRQTDFTYFKVVGWGWYYLSSVLGDFSRYTTLAVAWKLCPTMAATDVQDTLELALAQAQVSQVRVKLKPRLLSDPVVCPAGNRIPHSLRSGGHVLATLVVRVQVASGNGPAYLSSERRTYLTEKQLNHIRCAPFHPMTQGKTES